MKKIKFSTAKMRENGKKPIEGWMGLNGKIFTKDGEHVIHRGGPEIGFEVRYSEEKPELGEDIKIMMEMQERRRKDEEERQRREKMIDRIAPIIIIIAIIFFGLVSYIQIADK